MDTPLIDFKSVKDVAVEGWNAWWDFVADMVFPDVAIDFDEEEDFG